jgi:manganese-dependent inorganic pyrophosphatase
MIKVFGHKAPDTDTTCCAILWAWYLNEHTRTKAAPYVLGPLNNETAFVLNRWGLPTPAILPALQSTDQVAIVDTNNPQELPENINDTTIMSIIDHHKLVGGLKTNKPLEMIIRPLASTATVIHDYIGDHAETLPPAMQGLVLSCILSDTLAFRSPTTTPHDQSVAESIAKNLGVDIATYAAEMFAAKSDISSFSDAELIKLDSKKYEVGSKNFRVSVIETAAPQLVMTRKDGLVSAIKQCVQEESDCDEVLLFMIDILSESATAFTYNELTTQVIEKSFGVAVSGDTHALPGVVSRKTQIVPVLKM